MCNVLLIFNEHKKFEFYIFNFETLEMACKLIYSFYSNESRKFENSIEMLGVVGDELRKQNVDAIFHSKDSHFGIHQKPLVVAKPMVTYTNIMHTK